MAEKKNTGTEKNWFWRTIDSIAGDKVVWIIVLLFIMFSILAIFSSTSLLREGSKDRIDFITEHLGVAAFGLALTFFIYKIPWIGLFRALSKTGFAVSLIFLALLISKINIEGVIVSEYINGARRTLRIFGQQFHVYEVVKVSMVLYLAWAMHAYKEDQAALARKKPSRMLRLANAFAKTKNFSFISLPFWKRVIYMYIPIMTVTGLVMAGSNSSAIFIGGILLVVLLIGDLPKKEIFLAGLGVAAVLGVIIGIYKMTDGDKFKRVGTLISRFHADYSTEKLSTLTKGSADFYEELDRIKQPYSAQIAVHEGGIIGKHSGNSTQKYVVSNIYGDYMYSFIIEEYGLLGGIIVLFLYVTLLARGSMIARNCSNEFAKIAVGGLSILITGQAFMHMMVNVGLMPMTGQTLPLISHGSFAFLVFCMAFGVILSISRMAQKRIREEEELARPLYESDKDDLQVTMDVLEQL